MLMKGCERHKLINRIAEPKIKNNGGRTISCETKGQKTRPNISNKLQDECQQSNDLMKNTS